MRTIKLNLSIIAYLCVTGLLISCETTTNDTNISYVETSNASFVVQKTTNTVETKTRIQGTWKSSKGGDKYKWVFNDNSLAKSTIYSFGEIGEPQMYNLKYLNGFNGQNDAFGDYVYLLHEGSDKGVCYLIRNANANQVILESKFGDKIILKK